MGAQGETRRAGRAPGSRGAPPDGASARPRLRGRHVHARLEPRRRSLPRRRRDRREFPAPRRRPQSGARGQGRDRRLGSECRTDRGRRAHQIRSARDCRRRLVGQARQGPGEQGAARERARLPHHAARPRCCRQPHAALGRGRLRRDPHGDGAAGSPARSSSAGSTFPPITRAPRSSSRGPSVSSPGSTPRAAPNGWAIAPRFPTRSP